MIFDSIAVRQYKCLPDFRLPLKALTLLTGHNAAGKSTSIQPLILLAQAARSKPTADHLDLNGPLIRVGNASEIVTSSSDRTRQIDFEISSSEPRRALRWELEVPEESGGRTLKVLTVSDITETSVRKTHSGALFPSNLDVNEFRQKIERTIYLGAARSGTSDAFPTPDNSNIHADVGVEGQFAAWWYARFADEEIDEKRRHAHEEGLTLRRQLDAYFGELFLGGQANAEQIPRTSLSRLAFRMSQTSDWLRPINVGFGLSYVFPLLVALLLAHRGQLLIVDSPEAHLHPLGQSRMGRLLAIIAASGVQLIVETHSDHILNGIRLAVKDQVIPHTDVSLNFFTEARPGVSSNISHPNINSDGAIDRWLPGFFDQADQDITELAGIGE